MNDIIQKLRDLGTGVEFPKFPEYGLCAVLRNEGYSYLVKELYEAVEHWPKHSGDSTYPVPHPIFDPEEAYESTFCMWKRGETTDEYILNRRDLCLWFADYLEQGCGTKKIIWRARDEL